MMRLVALAVVLLVDIVAWSKDAGTDWAGLRKSVVEMRHELARSELYDFVMTMKERGISVPYIHSQSWVDWLPGTEVERRLYEQEKRDFGIDVVAKLEDLSCANKSCGDKDMQERHIRMLFSIVKWLSEEKGYGNFWLKRWAEDIALEALGRLSINEQCPVCLIEDLLKGKDSLERDLDFAMAILKEEAPHEFKRPLGNDIDSIQDELVRQWERHHKEASDMLQKRMGTNVYSFGQVKNEPKEYTFYIPDHYGASSVERDYPTVRYSWPAKNHYRTCVLCLHEGLSEKIREVVKFRKLLGLPERPDQSVLNDDDAAFEYRLKLYDMWKPYEKEYGKTKAPTAFVALYANRFVGMMTGMYINAQREIAADVQK